MAKKRKKRKVAPPPKPAVKRKAPGRAAPAPKRKPRGQEMEKMLAGWSDRLGLSAYTGRDWGRFAVLALGLGVIILYSFSAGGYFVVRRSYGELIILWLIVVGLLFELQSRDRMPRAGMVELGFVAAYTAWTLLSVIWSITPARSFDEFVRGLLYIGGFGLFYLYMARKEWLGWLGHIFVAIVAVVAIDALLGKTFPDLINHPDPFQSNRINYPLTYWNTMALFMIMGFVIGLRVLADRVTHIAVRCIYAPVMFLFLVVLWYTFSRAGLLLLAGALCLYLVFATSRLRAVLQTGLLGLWTAVVVGISYAFLPNMVVSVPSAGQKISEGHRLAVVIVIFMGIAAAAQFAISALEDKITISAQVARRIGYGLAAASATLLVVAMLAFTFSGGRGGPVAFVQEQFTDLSGTEGAVEKPSERLFSLKSERFQEYGVSLKRFGQNPLQGTGAGTWAVAWKQYRPWDIQVKDGHSLFFETMAELGLVGILLLAGFVATFFTISIRDLRFLKGRDRELYGAFFVAGAAFLVHAMIDWDWEMPVITLAFFMIAGGLLRYGQLARAESGEEQDRTGAAPRPTGLKRFLGWNWIIGAVCIGAMVVTIIPMVAASKLQAAVQTASSQRPDYGAIERAAQSAGAWGPLDAEPLVLQALAKQGKGRPDEAEKLLLDAAGKEPENDAVYRNLTRVYLQEYDLAKERGDAAAQQEFVAKSVEAITRARALNPLEPKETGDLEIQVRQIGGEIPPAPDPRA